MMTKRTNRDRCICTPIATQANVLILNAVLFFFMITPAFITVG